MGKGTFISSDVNVSNTLLYQTESKDIIELGTVHPPYEQNTYIIDFIKNVLKQPEMDRFYNTCLHLAHICKSQLQNG